MPHPGELGPKIHLGCFSAILAFHRLERRPNQDFKVESKKVLLAYLAKQLAEENCSLHLRLQDFARLFLLEIHISKEERVGELNAEMPLMLKPSANRVRKTFQLGAVSGLANCLKEDWMQSERSFIMMIRSCFRDYGEQFDASEGYIVTAPLSVRVRHGSFSRIYDEKGIWWMDDSDKDPNSFGNGNGNGQSSTGFGSLGNRTNGAPQMSGSAGSNGSMEAEPGVSQSNVQGAVAPLGTHQEETLVAEESPLDSSTQEAARTGEKEVTPLTEGTPRLTVADMAAPLSVETLKSDSQTVLKQLPPSQLLSNAQDDAMVIPELEHHANFSTPPPQPASVSKKLPPPSDLPQPCSIASDNVMTENNNAMPLSVAMEEEIEHSPPPPPQPTSVENQEEVVTELPTTSGIPQLQEERQIADDNAEDEAEAEAEANYLAQFNAATLEDPVADHSAPPPQTAPMSAGTQDEAADSVNNDTPSTSLVRPSARSKKRARRERGSPPPKRKRDARGESEDAGEMKFIFSSAAESVKGRRPRINYADVVPENIMLTHKWTVEARLKNALAQHPTLDPDFRKKFAEFLEKIAVYPKHDYLTRNVALPYTAPFQGNYRSLNQYYEENTIKSVEYVEEGDGSAPVYLERLRAAGKLFIDLNISAREALEKNKNWIANGRNKVFSQETLPEIVPDQELLDEERKAWNVPADSFEMPVPEFTPRNKEEIHCADLQEAVQSLPILVIRDFVNVAGVNKELFEIDSLVARSKGIHVDMRTQISQSHETNFNMDGDQIFGIVSIKKMTNIQGFAAHHREHLKKSISYLNRIIDSFDWDAEHKKIVDESVEESNADGFACATSAFGINIDLSSKLFGKELEDFNARIPQFGRMVDEENILDRNNLKIPILGMNEGQLYVKEEGVRTAPHTENSHMRSININMGGTGTSIWIATMPEYNDQFSRLIELHVKEGKTPHTAFSQDYWITVEELKAAKIPFMLFEQKPGDLVFINCAVPHFVASEGPSQHFSWNVGQYDFQQISAAMISQALAVEKNHEIVFPLFYTAWRVAARRTHRKDEKFVAAIRSILLRSLVYQQMSLDFYKSKGYLELTQEKKSCLRGFVRCNGCLVELYNIYLVSQLQTAWLPYCNECAMAIQDELRVKIHKPIKKLIPIVDHYTFDPTP